MGEVLAWNIIERGNHEKLIAEKGTYCKSEKRFFAEIIDWNYHNEWHCLFIGSAGKKYD